ncbi:hypothetical protein VCHA49P379_430002 [Vibrio chagasii]|nr:hypothetical protein VCHA28FP16_410001 [Vibrio chagasii]CAH7172573.1 hypothetical protein VCHA29O37_950002 [Vibrio chagasii]CAH7309405.1 hypothetical protein VCHA49P379_430002 [Vibrio chagasii]
MHVYSVSLWGATPNLYGLIHSAKVLIERVVYYHLRTSQSFSCLLCLLFTIIYLLTCGD